MADQPVTLGVEIPPEPPEYSVVAHGDRGLGKVWMREDLVGQHTTGWWYPAGSYYDERDRETVAALRWPALLARCGTVSVLRWGKEAVADEVLQLRAETTRLSDLVAELRRHLEARERQLQQRSDGEETAEASGHQVLHVHWAPAVVKSAADTLRAVLNVSDAEAFRFGEHVISRMEVACLVDLARHFTGDQQPDGDDHG